MDNHEYEKREDKVPNLQKSAKTIEITEDEDFSYEGFQVVRGEFFSHIYEPTFTFNNYKVYVNTACVKKLPNVDYIQLLVNPIEKKLVVRPCREDEKDSLRWSSKSVNKRAPKQITCKIFCAKILSMMNWNPEYRYKLLGKLIKSGEEYLFVFDLTSPEIFIKTSKEGEKARVSRKPTYPEEWKNQFGIPVENHQNNLQINIFNGYTVFSVQNNEESKTEKRKEEINEQLTIDADIINRYEEEQN